MIQSVEVQTSKSRAAALSIISNSLLIILKLVVGIMMQSVSVISEAVHSGLDLIAAIIAWFSIRESGKPADDKHRFGHGKIENVAGTIEAVLVGGCTGNRLFTTDMPWPYAAELDSRGNIFTMVGISVAWGAGSAPRCHGRRAYSTIKGMVHGIFKNKGIQPGSGHPESPRSSDPAQDSGGVVHEGVQRQEHMGVPRPAPSHGLPAPGAAQESRDHHRQARGDRGALQRHQPPGEEDHRRAGVGLRRRATADIFRAR